MEGRVEQDVLDSPAAGGLAVRGAAVRGLGYGVVVSMTIVSAAVLTRQLGAEGFGKYTVITSLAAIVAALTDAGTTNVGIREYATLHGAARERLLANLLGLRIVLSALGVAAAVVFAAAAGYGGDVIAGTAIAGAAVLAGALQTTYAIPLATGLRLGWLAVVDVVRQIVIVVAILVLAAAGAGLLPLVAAGPFGVVLATFLTLRLIRTSAPIVPAVDRERWVALLRLTGPYAAAVAVGAVYSYVVIVVVSLVSTETETGLFSAAFRSFFAVAGLSSALVASAFPILARAAQDDADRLAYGLGLVSRTALVASAGFAVCIAVGAPFAIAVVAGAEYDDAVRPLQILSIAVVTTYVLASWTYGLLALKRHSAILVANAAGLAATLAFTAILGSAYGADGGAIALVGGELVVGIVYIAALRRAGITPLPSPVIPRVALAAAAGLAAFLVPAPDVVRLVVAAAAFAAVALAVRAAPPELLAAFLHRRRPTA